MIIWLFNGIIYLHQDYLVELLTRSTHKTRKYFAFRSYLAFGEFVIAKPQVRTIHYLRLVVVVLVWFCLSIPGEEFS